LVGERGGGGDGGGSSLYDLAGKILPGLIDKLPANLGQLAAPGAPPARAMQHNPAPLMARVDQAAPMGQAQKIDQAQKLKAYLLGEAAKGTDPAMCVDFAAENMPAELEEALLQADDALALIMQAIPEARPFQNWFARLLDLMFTADETAPLNGGGGDGLQPGSTH
jgi:hypothetical protein